MPELVKNSLQAGVMKDRGADATGMTGYSIIELSGPELFKALLQWTPYVRFKVIPIITVDQMIEGIKEVT